MVEGLMFRAAWNGAVPAESDRTMKVEGRHYLPGPWRTRRPARSSRRCAPCSPASSRRRQPGRFVAQPGGRSSRPAGVAAVRRWPDPQARGTLKPWRAGQPTTGPAGAPG